MLDFVSNECQYHEKISATHRMTWSHPMRAEHRVWWNGNKEKGRLFKES